MPHTARLGTSCLHLRRLTLARPALSQPTRQLLVAIHTRASNLTLTRRSSWRLQTRAVTTMAEVQLPNLGSLSLDSLKEKNPFLNPETNLYDTYRAHLSQIISGITGASNTIVYPAISWSTTIALGDFIIAVPALRLKGVKPDALAVDCAEKFPKDDPLFNPPHANGNFLAFYVRGDALARAVIPKIQQLGAEYGYNKTNGLRDPKDPSQGNKRIIVEFSSPNIAKPFHAGHLRSTIIGSFLANLHEAAGWDVTRINYLGDWGKQYGLLALAFNKYGDEEALKKEPIDHLFKLYVRINADKEAETAEIEAKKKEGQDVTELEANSLDEEARRYFRKMTDRDASALALWERFRDLSIVRYKETYARLNIKFDEYSGESQVSEEAMEKVLKQMEEKKIMKEDKGSQIVDFTEILPGKEGKRLGKCVIRKRDGTALYLTRDLAELLGRYEKYKFDKMIYVVASQQDLHLQQLFKIINLLGYTDIAQRCQHINFGMVLGMSTRKGTVKFLADILQDCGEHMHEVMRKNEKKYAQVENPESTADTLGISGVMTQDMKGKRNNNYNFDLNVMMSFEGDTGPYLQYAHARLSSIRRKVNETEKTPVTDEELAKADLSLLSETHAVNVVRVLAQYPDVVQNTLKTLEPATILTYLFQMTHVISSSYDHLQVVGSERPLLVARLALYDAARTVLSNGMRLLGLSPLSRM
ncbi:arginyl-tRNA synthetase [Xylariaceae sp. FL0804]|nr:arginyl-tRNA synthetase [Xylariaceae sp. FL0804]